MTPQARWRPLLYGRTARADRWWRLRPYDVSIEWLNAVVAAGAGGGEGLAGQPRFLLARGGPVLLVGAACQAGALSDTMNSDGSRPFYAFVGWLTQDASALPPDWATLAEGWKPWCAEVYQDWMPLDWHKHRTDLGDGHESPFCQAPWAPAIPAARANDAESLIPPYPGETLLVPATAAPALWAGLSAARFDFVFAASFDRPPANARGTLTHIAVASISTPAVQYAANPPPQARPADERPRPVASEPMMPRSSPRVPEREAAEARTRPPEWTPGRGEPASEEGGRRGAPARQRGDPPHPSPRRQESQGGLLNRVIHRIIPHEEEPDTPPGEPFPPAGTQPRDDDEPQHGPMKDLEYWAQQERAARPRPGGLRKKRPSADDL